MFFISRSCRKENLGIIQQWLGTSHQPMLFLFISQAVIRRNVVQIHRMIERCLNSCKQKVSYGFLNTPVDQVARFCEGRISPRIVVGHAREKAR